jgi:hypothetical protein
VGGLPTFANLVANGWGAPIRVIREIAIDASGAACGLHASKSSLE